MSDQDTSATEKKLKEEGDSILKESLFMQSETRASFDSIALKSVPLRVSSDRSISSGGTFGTAKNGEFGYMSQILHQNPKNNWQRANNSVPSKFSNPFFPKKFSNTDSYEIQKNY